MRTPAFKILANDKDITFHIQKNLISLSFRDEAGILGDSITLEIAGEFRRPKYRDILKLWIGYKESGLWYSGSFFVQVSEKSFQKMSITALGADFSGELKVKKNRGFENTNLKEIVQKIAREHNLDYQADFEKINISYCAQDNKSDLEFLKSLSLEYGAFFSIKNNKILFLNKGESEKLPIAKIDLKEVQSYTIKHSNKTKYASAKAIWQDTKDNSIKEVIIGAGEPQLRVEGSFQNSSDALLKAEAKLKRANARIISGNISLYGSKIYAGGILELSSAGEDSGIYNIKSVVHHLSANGFTTDVEFEN